MNRIISLRIIFLVQSGKSLQEAIDTVLGAGAFDKLAGEVYETLRAE